MPVAMLLALGVASASHAHMGRATRSLRSLVAQADLVVHARSVGVEDVVISQDGRSAHRPALSVEVLGVIKGAAEVGKPLVFVQHGHGVAQYRPGEEALFFLRDLTRSRELRRLGSTGTLRWYSTQEHDEDYVLSPGSRRATLAAARAYAALEASPSDQRVEALRRITFKLLASRNARLAASALSDLVRAGKALPVTVRDIPGLEKVIDDSGTPIGVRMGLLAELEQRSLLRGDVRWVQLLRSTRGADRIAVIRVVGVHPSPAVNRELVKILKGADAAAGSAAAIALGYPGNAAAVEPLERELASGDARRVMAAIRGLGRIGTPEARAALSSTATSHPDPAIRRRAAAELRLQ